MQADYAEVVNFSRVDQFNRMYVKKGDTGFNENIVFADAAFFDMFSFPLIQGDAGSVLTEPYSILLSESQAKKYFGPNWKKEKVLGEALIIDNQYEVTITGVFEDVPANSHIPFDILASWSTLGKAYGTRFEDSWRNSNFMGYLQLKPGTDPNTVEEKFIDFSQKYFKGAEVTGYVEKFYLQPLKDIHLHSDLEYETWAHGSATTVTALILIAGLILIITWVNYINLSTAISLGRAKEVSLRKVVGARKTQIIKQFLFESLLLNTLGLVIALGIVRLFQPVFSKLLSVQFSLSLLINSTGALFLAIFLAGTLMSLLYPAFMNSSFKTVTVLRGKFTQTGRGRLIRKGLVVFQFVLSFALIAGTYTVYSQIDYMMDEDLGMNIDQILVLSGPALTNVDSAYYDNIQNFKSELRLYPEIKNVTASLRLPGRRTGRIFNIRRLTGDSQQLYTTSDIGVDYEFFETFDMKILAGRGFDRSDHNLDFNAIRSVVLNESASKLMGFENPQAAVNQEINFWRKDWEIVGVVGDHHQQSLHVPLEPIIFTPLYTSSNFFFVKVNTNSLPQTIDTIKTRYLELFPGNSFNYFFLDEFFNQQYQTDQIFRTIFSLFSALGVFLASLGLFGLSFFATAQRTKEIGVRKVVGATTVSILGLLYKDFSKLVLLAILVASPFTYFTINRWLSGYAYHINISWTMLVVPGIFISLIALLTVSYKTFKTALLNPVDPLRHE
jgi:putative ABC transport system permease protein